MTFIKGDQRPLGAGRRPGSKNKRTVELEKAVAATGKTPLQVLLDSMNHYLEVGNLDKAVLCAKDAAPYVHPKITSISVGGQLGAPPIETREVSNVELARRIAFIFNQAAREQVANGGD
jgi:hypothetical protein